MSAALVLVETEALNLFHNELKAGAPADVAAKNVLASLESKISNPVAKAIVTTVLSALVAAIEAAAAATPAA